MRAIKPNNRRRGAWGKALLGLSALLLGGAGTVGVLVLADVIPLQKLAFWRKARVIPPGWVGIPRCAKALPPYAAVTRDHLLNPLTRDWFMDYEPPEKAQELARKGVILDIDKIRGRVTAREHAAGLFFAESDFLPVGSRPGVVGGTPPGQLAITLDASKLKGVVYELNRGDHVVLQASIAVDMPGAGHAGGGRLGANVVAAPDVALLPKRSLVRTLVQDGVVVVPVQTRNVPVSSSSLTQGMTTRTMPVQEIVLAVDPEEVPLLNEAMDLKYEITCMARSGRPLPMQSQAPQTPGSGGARSGAFPVLAALAQAVLGGGSAAAPGQTEPAAGGATNAGRSRPETPSGSRPAATVTPGLDPLAHTRFLEVMIGPQRQFILFTGPGNAPVVAMRDDGAAATGSATGAGGEGKPAGQP
jgi:hypothetical protein